MLINLVPLALSGGVRMSPLDWLPIGSVFIILTVALIAFELGLRFFTDYLAGNVYFKARHPEHNLARALVQFNLTGSIESQVDAIGAIIRDLR